MATSLLDGYGRYLVIIDAIMDEPVNFDAYAPPEIAKRVETVGVAKASMAFVPLLTLSILAGVFISLGAAFYTVTVAGAGLDGGLGRVAGGLAFSLGLILVVIGGAELFTGNNLIVMAWADRRITMAALLRNWSRGSVRGAPGHVDVNSMNAVLNAGSQASSRMEGK